jgi:hypothetical protein
MNRNHTLRRPSTNRQRTRFYYGHGFHGPEYCTPGMVFCNRRKVSLIAVGGTGNCSSHQSGSVSFSTGPNIVLVFSYQYPYWSALLRINRISLVQCQCWESGSSRIRTGSLNLDPTLWKLFIFNNPVEEKNYSFLNINTICK